MSKNQFRQPFDPLRALMKLVLSGFVLVTFAAYVAYERLIRPDAALAQASAGATSTPAASAPLGPFTFPTSVPALPQAQVTPVPTTQQAGYKNGTYQGPPVDAYYGLVQVQVTIQNGAIHDVQFLQYPNDRRTSQEINAQVMPWLQQEAIQAQSANVDIISGATLTSEGFQMSLQSALQQAAHN
jgi:uncharacterized protein with FMN-binding domain